MTYPRVNGDGGIYLFPVADHVAYVVRDNRACCRALTKSSHTFDVFVITGDRPTFHDHKHSYYIGSTRSYQDACRAIEMAVDRAKELTNI